MSVGAQPFLELGIFEEPAQITLQIGSVVARNETDSDLRSLTSLMPIIDSEM